MTRRRGIIIYSLLGIAWLLILGWQTAEHFRVQTAARAQLIYRAKDISTTLGIVLRSQRRWGFVSKERLESTLNDLVKPDELNGIALLNAAGSVVASAGSVGDFETKTVAGPAEHWGRNSVILVNLVDLGTSVGTNTTQDPDVANPPIVLPREQFFRPSTNIFGTNRVFGFGAPPPPPNDTNRADAPKPPPDSAGPPPPHHGTNHVEAPKPPGPPWGGGRPHFGRPPWMSKAEYQTMVQKAGVHGFVIVMSTQPLSAAIWRDLWIRLIIGFLATFSVLGSALAWRNINKTSELQLRLVRASELNSHLKEMNLAAAGLAHETRNPLNIIRGLAQMISKQPEALPEIREQSRAIVNETDKVTAQLNEFINYSRPREVRRTPLSLSSAVNEVVRALGYDIEEKKVQLEIKGEQLMIEADEQLLRQALFNLIMNAIQAIDVGGHIEVMALRQDNEEGILEIRDDGPGVAAELRKEVFKPYFTTNQKGTGLGLAIVQQIMLAHGWEIECLPNEPKGAIFRVTHLKLAAKH